MSDYTDWVRTQPCCITGAIGDFVDPHHIKGYAHVTGAGGKLKGSDLACIPLRHDLHNELHSIGWQSFEKKYNINQLEEAWKTLLQADALGIIKICQIQN